MMIANLNDAQIRFICNHIVHRRDWSVFSIAMQYGIAARRVRQLVSEYRRAGTVPALKNARRKKSPPLTQEEKKAILSTPDTP